MVVKSLVFHHLPWFSSHLKYNKYLWSNPSGSIILTILTMIFKKKKSRLFHDFHGKNPSFSKCFPGPSSLACRVNRPGLQPPNTQGRSVADLYSHICMQYICIPSGYLTVCHGKSPFLIGKPSINGPFSMAMLNNQRVIIYIYMSVQRIFFVCEKNLR